MRTPLTKPQRRPPPITAAAPIAPPPAVELRDPEANPDFAARQIEVLDLLRAQGRLSLNQLRTATGRGKFTIQHDLHRLEVAGRVRLIVQRGRTARGGRQPNLYEAIP